MKPQIQIVRLNVRYLGTSLFVAAALAAGLTLPAVPALAQGNIQKIVVRVNGTPITNLDIRQRTNLIMMTAPDIRKRVQDRSKRAFKAPGTQDRFRAFVKANSPTSQAEANALQKKFGRRIVDRARASVRSSLRSRALSALIDDQIKLQEAKKRGLLVSEEEADKRIDGLAKRNKMTRKQFITMLRKRGIHPTTMRNQLQAQASWQRVARARLRREVSVRAVDIDLAVANDPAAERGKVTELDLHRIILPSKTAFDTTQFEQARALSQRFTGCASTAALAKRLPGAKFKKLGRIKAGTLPDSARPLLLATPEGKMAPPVFTPNGIALYAVCSRREVASSDKMRQKARTKLQNQQMVTLARRLLKDLCQEAYIEPPVANGRTARCGET